MTSFQCVECVRNWTLWWLLFSTKGFLVNSIMQHHRCFFSFCHRWPMTSVIGPHHRSILLKLDILYILYVWMYNLVFTWRSGNGTILVFLTFPKCLFKEKRYAFKLWTLKYLPDVTWELFCFCPCSRERMYTPLYVSGYGLTETGFLGLYRY